MSNKPLKELNTQEVGWVPISYDFGRDPIFCEIDDDDIILAASGLAVAGLALALTKDDDWISYNELKRTVMPGSFEKKLEAAAALCSVGHWELENRDGIDGWRLGVTKALEAKRARHNRSSNAAQARYKKSPPATPPQEEVAPPEEDPFSLYERTSG